MELSMKEILNKYNCDVGFSLETNTSNLNKVNKVGEVNKANKAITANGVKKENN